MAKENELVAIQKDGIRLEVSPSVLEAHLRKGWVMMSDGSLEALMVPVPEGVSLEDAEKALEALAKKGKKQPKSKEQEPDQKPEQEPEETEQEAK